jgi:GT2 family glycosyltransferase
LPYEIVWVDNGSPPHALAAARRRLPPVEKLAALGANNGIAFGLNTAFFRLCSASYIVSLEEDWALCSAVARAARHAGATSAFIEHSIAVIDADSGIAGVILRNETYDQFRAARCAWTRLASTSSTATTARRSPAAWCMAPTPMARRSIRASA